MIKLRKLLRFTVSPANTDRSVIRLYAAFSTNYSHIDAFKHADIPVGSSIKKTARLLRELADEVEFENG
jgi:hypothetical protein